MDWTNITLSSERTLSPDELEFQALGGSVDGTGYETDEEGYEYPTYFRGMIGSLCVDGACPEDAMEKALILYRAEVLRVHNKLLDRIT